MAPPAPTFDAASYSRVWGTGTVEVTGVDPAHTAEVYAIGFLGDTPAPVLVGSRMGDGTVNLDFTLLGVGWAGLGAAVCWGVVQDDLGNYSPPSALAAPPLFIEGPALAVTNIVRSPDGTEVTFTAAGLPLATDVILVTWAGVGGEPGVAVFTGNGDHTISGLDGWRMYSFTVIPVVSNVQAGMEAMVFFSIDPWPDYEYASGSVPDLLTAIKESLESDPHLAAYNEVVSIQKFLPGSLPDFETYGVIVSPQEEDIGVTAVREKQKKVRVNIHCLVYEFDKSKCLIGKEAGEIGLLEMVRHVRERLNNAPLSGLVEVHGREIADQPISYVSVWSQERQGYYQEAAVATTWLMMPFVE